MKIALSRKNIWDRLPPAIKYSIGSILSIIPPKHLLGKEYQHNISFIEQAQWWPSEKIQEYQFSELKKICTLAYEKSNYYKRTFRDAGFNPHTMKSVEDFHTVPVINRDDINNNIAELPTLSLNSPTVDYITTGGTSGVPLRFYINKNRSSTEYSYLVSSWKRVGYELGIPFAVIRGKIIKKNRHGIYHEYDPILRHHYYSNFHMNDENMGKYIEHIKSLGSCFLHAYPSSVANLARFIKRSNISPPENILAILAESENVYEDQRKMVEDVFKRRYFSSYGHTEKLVAAAECENSSNYHIWPTYGYFELLDQNNQPVTEPGKRGEIVGTGFINTVVPFIRYRTGDFATFIGDRCDKCGREHTIITDIQGHNIQENLIAYDGSLITWAAVNMHDDTFDNVLQFQFYQDSPGYAVLKVVPSADFSIKDEQKIKHKLEVKFKDRLEFSIKQVGSVSLSSRGKAIFVDQKLSL